MQVKYSSLLQIMVSLLWTLQLLSISFASVSPKLDYGQACTRTEREGIITSLGLLTVLWFLQLSALTLPHCGELGWLIGQCLPQPTGLLGLNSLTDQMKPWKNRWTELLPMHDQINLTEKPLNSVSIFLGQILQFDKKGSLFVLASDVRASMPGQNLTWYAE